MTFNNWEDLQKLLRSSKKDPSFSLPTRYTSFREGHYTGSWFFLFYTSIFALLYFIWFKVWQLIKSVFRFTVDKALFFLPLRRWFADFWKVFWGPWHLLFVFFGPFVILFFNYLVYKLWAHLFFGPILLTSSCFGFIVQECTTYVDFWYSIERLSVSRNWNGLSWLKKYYEYFWYLIKLYNQSYRWRPDISYQVWADELMRIGVHVKRIKLPTFPPKNFPIIHQFLGGNELSDVRIRNTYKYHWKCVLAVYTDVAEQILEAYYWAWWYAIGDFEGWPLKTDDFLASYKSAKNMKDWYYDRFYFEPVRHYLKKLLSLYPGLPDWGPSISLYISEFVEIIYIGFTQFFSIKPYIIFLSRLSDPVFIVEYLGSKIMFIIICIYGLPFLVASYVAIYLSAALASVEILLWSFFCMFVDYYCGSFGSMLDFIKRALSSNPKVHLRPRELIILYLADLWMIFYILPVMSILLVIPIGCALLLWYVFFVPMIWVYFILYSPSGGFRGFREIIRLFFDQIRVIFYIFKVKIAYSRYYFSISYGVIKGLLLGDTYSGLREEFKAYADNKEYDCSLDRLEFAKNEEYYALRLTFIRLAKSKPIQEKTWHDYERLVPAWGSESCWYSDVQSPEPKLTHSVFQIFFRTVILFSVLLFTHILLNFEDLIQIVVDAASPTKITCYPGTDRVLHRDIGYFPDDFSDVFRYDYDTQPELGWEDCFAAWSTAGITFWYAEVVYAIACWYAVYALLFCIIVFFFAIVSRTFKEILFGSSYFFLCSFYSACWLVYANAFGEDFLTCLYPATWNLEWMRVADFNWLDEDWNFTVRGFFGEYNAIEDTLHSRRSERKYQETYWWWWRRRRLDFYVPIYNALLKGAAIRDAYDVHLMASRLIKDVFVSLHTAEWWSGKKPN